MDINKVMLVRGFDLFFSDASDETIERIAKQLGGNYDFDFVEEEKNEAKVIHCLNDSKT